MLDHEEDIQFKALTSGLGFRIPQIALDTENTKVSPPNPSKTANHFPKTANHFLSLWVDHLFIFCLIALFVLSSVWQFPLPHVKELIHIQTIGLYGLLWMMLMMFYFMFFKQFKIPSFGKRFIKK